MAGLVEKVISDSVQSLMKRDSDLAKKTIASDDAINDLELVIEETLTKLKENYTIILVPHNIQQASRVADRAGFFLNGELVEEGPAFQIFTHPRDKRTEDYVTGKFG